MISVLLATSSLMLNSCNKSAEETSRVLDTVTTSILWQANAATCTTRNSTQGIRYTLCGGNIDKKTMVPVSMTTAEGILDLPFLTNYNIRFSCEALGTMSPVKWNIAQDYGDLMPGATAQISATALGIYRDQPLELKFTPNPAAVVKPGCQITLGELVKYTEPTAVKIYARMLSNQQKNLKKLLPLVSPNIDTATLVDALDNAIITIDITLDLYGDGLNAISKDSLVTAKLGLDRALSKLKTCETTSDCTLSKTEARKSVEEMSNANTEEINEVIKFLRDEIARLEKINTHLSESIKAALAILQA